MTRCQSRPGGGRGRERQDRSPGGAPPPHQHNRQATAVATATHAPTSKAGRESPPCRWARNRGAEVGGGRTAQPTGNADRRGQVCTPVPPRPHNAAAERGRGRKEGSRMGRGRGARGGGGSPTMSPMMVGSGWKRGIRSPRRVPQSLEVTPPHIFIGAGRPNIQEWRRDFCCSMGWRALLPGCDDAYQPIGDGPSATVHSPRNISRVSTVSFN